MRARTGGRFTTVWAEGATFPPDLLQRILSGDRELGGLDPDSYRLAPGERLNEAITRSWNRLVGAWATFRDARTRLPEQDPGTSATRERWLLPLFQELGYGRLVPARAVEVGGKSYPVSHAYGAVPIHLVGCRVPLDHRTRGVAGAAGQSPHGLVQELLNREPERLYGFVSNGLVLRLLRDNASLTRQAYLEFDLEGMFEGEVYADFVLLWLVCHQSRVEGPRPEEWWLERWSRAAAEQGTRALDGLRRGVEEAITVLGRGFLAHPANDALRDALRGGRLTPEDLYRELLRLVYRLLFFFVAEDRGLLLDPTADAAAGDRFERHYSTARLRRLAERHRGTRHGDLWEAFRLVMRLLGEDRGCPGLALPALGSFLWSRAAIEHLDAASLANAELLEAVRALAFVEYGGARRNVDYRNLGTEELGSVYEALLALHPSVNVDAAVFSLAAGAGNEQKMTGSYYTHPSLVQGLLNSALDPVLDEAARSAHPEAAILDLKVCDPACGSGHFLVAAAHRIARRLALVTTGDAEPSPEATRKALRRVISRCIYGVDMNEIAVELCKVALWMEALEPGRPLSFLDHHIQCGNSLIGATPALLSGGIPDDAFRPIEGDDSAFAAARRRENRADRRTGQGRMTELLVAEPGAAYDVLPDRLARLEEIPDDSIASVQQKESEYRRLAASADHVRARLVADTWCAAFFWRKTADAPPPVTHDLFMRVREDPAGMPEAVRGEVARLAGQYRFFHWHVAFPQVFRVPASERPENERAGWSGGFDVVLGNPPWERVKLQEKEFFEAAGRTDIANARNKAERRRLIGRLRTEDEALWGKYLERLRASEAESHFLRNSGRYPFTGRGDVNTYAVFAEDMRTLVSAGGRVGCIVPTGIATDDTTRHFFADLVAARSLASLYDFENREKLFPAVDSRMKFCLLTVTGPARPVPQAEFVFFAHTTADLADTERRFTLAPEDFELLNPNTRTCPIFRTRRDAEITKAIYRRVPVLVNKSLGEKGNPWGVEFLRMFDMSNDSRLFRARDQLEVEGFRLDGNVFRRGDEVWLPLYEAKMVAPFDHRAAHVVISKTAMVRQGQPDELSDEDHADPSCLPIPRYWVPQGELNMKLGGWEQGWLLGWRDVTSATNERTVLATIIPRVAAGHKFLLMLPTGDLRRPLLLGAMMNSFVYDYVCRQKLGGVSLTYFVLEQLPMLPLEHFTRPAPWAACDTTWAWISCRLLELVYTAWDLRTFARDFGYDGPPFRWDPERRFLLRAELDASCFHLYGVRRDDAEYILDTFPIVCRKDEAKWGEYRTKRVILEIYDAMTRAIETGESYQAVLDPPPADPRVAHAPPEMEARPTPDTRAARGSPG